MSRTAKQVTLDCLSGKEDCYWPACVKRVSQNSPLQPLRYEFGMLSRAGKGFTLVPFNSDGFPQHGVVAYVIDFDSADAVVNDGWLVD